MHTSSKIPGGIGIFLSTHGSCGITGTFTGGKNSFLKVPASLGSQAKPASCLHFISCIRFLSCSHKNPSGWFLSIISFLSSVYLPVGTNGLGCFDSSGSSNNGSPWMCLSIRNSSGNVAFIGLTFLSTGLYFVNTSSVFKLIGFSTPMASLSTCLFVSSIKLIGDLSCWFNLIRSSSLFVGGSFSTSAWTFSFLSFESWAFPFFRCLDSYLTFSKLGWDLWNDSVPLLSISYRTILFLVLWEFLGLFQLSSLIVSEVFSLLHWFCAVSVDSDLSQFSPKLKFCSIGSTNRLFWTFFRTGLGLILPFWRKNDFIGFKLNWSLFNWSSNSPKTPSLHTQNTCLSPIVFWLR